MLGQKEGLVRAVARVFPLENTSKEALAGPWNEKNSSLYYHTVPNSVGYIDPIEESWSMNHDSAASMFAPTFPPALDLENFQDLSDYCCKPPQDTSSVMVGATKDSSCTVQDDELNTPDIGFQREFNFTSSNVLQEDNNPVCLLDPEGWGIPSLDLPQISIAEEKSTETLEKEDIDTTHKADGIYIDGGWDLSVGHEEEIVSQNQEEKLLIVSQNQDEEFVIVSQNQDEKFVNTSVHTKEEMGTNFNNQTVYEVGDKLVVKNISFDNFESVDNTVIPPKTCTSDIKNIHLESLLGAAHSVQTVSNRVTSVDSSKQQSVRKLTLESLLSDNINEISTTVESKENEQRSVNGHVAVSGETTGTDSVQYLLRTDLSQVNQEEQSHALAEVDITAKNITSQSSESLNSMAGSTVSEDSAEQTQSSHPEDNTLRRKMKLTLPPLLATDEISTPVVLDTLLGGNGKFDLVSYVFDNNQPLSLDSPDVKPDFLLSLISAGSSDSTAVAGPSHSMTQAIKTEVEDNQSTTIINEIVVDLQENSLDGQWNISQTDEMEVDEDDLSMESVEIRKFDQKPVEEQRKPLKVGKISRSRVGGRGHGGLPCHTELESKIQDGSSLKLKITKKIVRDDSIQKHISSKKKVSEQNKASPSKPRGRPAKRQYPSTSKEENLSRSRQRKYSSSSSVFDEPLTPQSKRSRLSSVESDCDRYRELRDRNNEASRKSRQNRKTRELEMKDTAVKLEKENQSLRIKAEEMERLVKKLRQSLIEAVAKPKRK